ncbi:MAG: hypothetical protein K8H88_13025 [Sandaracinaceae bacterium]|nr:hypothetical protein [Sandaracinaceae bacterium]
MRSACWFAVIALLATTAAASAQSAEAAAEEEGGVSREETDTTRLDVERLPPEAIQITRALYAHGFFLEGQLGAIGFLNGVGNYITPGPWASLAFGLEIADWFHVLLAAEGSMHRTDAPPPPRPTAFELVGGTASLRLQANFTPEFAAWISGQFGLFVATTDVLDIYGFQSASSVGIAYGGQLGVDWHFRARHHSIGLLGGLRHYPALEGLTGGAPALGIHGSAYMRYVF